MPDDTPKSEVDPIDEAAIQDKIEVMALAVSADVEKVAGAAICAQNQAWVASILPLISQCLTRGEWDVSPDPKVQQVVDSLIMTACARLKRILRSDLKS